MILSQAGSVYVAGHRGMVGSALVRALQKRRGMEIITATRDELELTRQKNVEDFVAAKRPDLIIVAAARVGGIHANATYPAEFIYDNMMVAANLTHAAWNSGVKRLLFLGSSCIYPRDAAQPMREDSLLSGPLEISNEA